MIRRELNIMWYRLAIKGEYWLTDYGPQFADGDVADDNHEMLAEGYMLGELGNDIGDEDWGTQTYSNAKNMFLDALQNPGTHLGQMEDYLELIRSEYGEDWEDYADYDDYLSWLNTQYIQDEKERQIKQEWVNREIGGMKNPREHVSQHYDWVAVRQKNVEVWEMNDMTRARIKNQIEQIYDEEGLSDENELWKEEPKFNLSILSTKQYIPNLTYHDLIEPGIEKKKARDSALDFFPDFRTNTAPTNTPGYQYQGG